MQIPIPKPICQIAENQDCKLAWYFVVFFSRFEYALKRTNKYLKKGSNDALPNWDKFASDYNLLFNPEVSISVKGAVNYFLKNPPRKQLNLNGSIGWSDPFEYDGKTSLLVWILLMIRCVRNNLFHGGKFPLVPISDPSRDRDILLNSLIILSEVLPFDAEVESYFFEDIAS